MTRVMSRGIWGNTTMSAKKMEEFHVEQKRELEILEARQLKLEAMDRAEAASLEWQREAIEAIKTIARGSRGALFTTDDIWGVLSARGVNPPKEPRAMGAATRWASKHGLIKSTGRYVKSKRPECHRRPIMVWERR